MTTRKGIILAGGSGTRLHPATRAISKQLMPIYDKPMIYYPLSTLMLTGIRDILIISTPRDLPLFRDLLRDGSQWGLKLSYAEQEKPAGLPQAFTIGEKFIGNENVAMILGDNLYHGHGLHDVLQNVTKKQKGATVFGYRVSTPERYGVISFDKEGKPVDIIEKPKNPASKWVITGFYFFDNRAVEIAKSLKPSPRGETEIVDVIRAYLQRGELEIEKLGRGVAWLDTGTHESLSSATDFVRIIEQRQGLKIGCPEEIAYTLGYIDAAQVQKAADEMGKTDYAAYLRELVSPEAR